MKILKRICYAAKGRAPSNGSSGITSVIRDKTQRESPNLDIRARVLDVGGPQPELSNLKLYEKSKLICKKDHFQIIP